MGFLTLLLVVSLLLLRDFGTLFHWTVGLLHPLTHLRSVLRHLSLIRHNRTVACASVLWSNINWLIDWLIDKWQKIHKYQEVQHHLHRILGTNVKQFQYLWTDEYDDILHATATAAYMLHAEWTWMIAFAHLLRKQTIHKHLLESPLDNLLLKSYCHSFSLGFPHYFMSINCNALHHYQYWTVVSSNWTT